MYRLVFAALRHVHSNVVQALGLEGSSPASRSIGLVEALALEGLFELTSSSSRGLTSMGNGKKPWFTVFHLKTSSAELYSLVLWDS